MILPDDVDSKQKQILRLLERAAGQPGELDDGEWILLMKALRLPLYYQPAVCAALKQDRWRSAKRPVAYIKAVTEREAVNLGLADDLREGLKLVPSVTGADGEDLSQDAAIDALEFRYTSTHKVGGKWRAATGTDWDNDDNLTTGEKLINQLPEDLRGTFEWTDYERQVQEDHGWTVSADPIPIPLWDKIAKRAGLDTYEQKVLEYKSQGISRDRALQFQPSEKSRKQLQAAWRRFDRKSDKIRQAIFKGKSIT
jgi:hypothetical protein